ncbi:MAG: DNA repair protein RecN [Clostridia bacterium]|nr:DNA repair protein RecN [Clostridia bacterium]
MLTRLKIANIALIDKSDIVFDAGFSALTGETGAGKSILIESVGFVLGERASRESIRTGADRAAVEATFLLEKQSPARAFLEEHQLDNGDELVLYRELSTAGRNVCRVNGTLVNTAELKQLGDLLVDLHGQHAHQSLLNVETHLGLIDAYAKSNADHLSDRVEEARQHALKVGHDLHVLKNNLQERERRIDTIRYQLKEIDAVAPVDGEEEQLESDRSKMRNAETIVEGLNAAYEALFSDSGALSSLSEARDALNRIGEYDPAYRAMSERTDDAYYAIEDVAYELRDGREAFRFDPDLLEQTESRLAALMNLKRKYGATLAEVLAYRDRLDSELRILTDGDNQVDSLEAAYRDAVQSFGTLAETLSARRKAAARVLCSEAVKQLNDMGMPHAKLEAAFTHIPAEQLSETGVDTVEFLLSANRGEPVKPLTKVASGGEMSRIMLAMKAALSDADSIETLVFDEIDTGISGMVANTVAKKMRALGEKHQVLCVTHLPQIAAYADAQYVAYKYSDAEKTHSVTRRLTESERPKELARIMGGEETDQKAMEHAKALLLAAKQ